MFHRPHPLAVLLSGLALAGACATTALAQAPVDDPAAAAAVATVENFHKALDAGDGKAALALLTPQLQVFESGHVERSRDEYASRHLDADIQFSKTAQSTLASRHAEVSGDSAWVLSESDVSSQRQGKPVKQRSIETMLLRQTPQGWRIVHIHWSSRTLKTE